jgi:chromosome partitioning protein
MPKVQKIVCVINLKGGVGKSTIAALLAQRAFRNRECDVLAVDLDPQANLSQALMRSRYTTFISKRRPSIVEVFNGYRSATSTSGPSKLGPDDAVETINTLNERSLQLIPSRFDFSDQLTQAIQPDPRVLARFISDKFKKKNLILIDCSPTESILTYAAYHASNTILVPVKPEYFATIGFPLLQESISKFKRGNRGSSIEVAGVVINNPFYDGGNNGGPEKDRSLKEIYEESSKNGWNVYDNEIPFSRGFPKMMRGDYSYLGNAYLFYKFADEFFESIGL